MNKQTESKHHLSRQTGDEEWYTPAAYIDAIRATMGSIDLDPASNAIAQQTVQATNYYTISDDGLAQEWRANTLFLNPPYSRRLVEKFAAKLCDSLDCGLVKEAVWLTNNSTDTRWFQELAKRCDALFLPQGRLGFTKPAPGGGTRTGTPLQGQAVLYFGKNGAEFCFQMTSRFDGAAFTQPGDYDARKSQRMQIERQPRLFLGAN